MDYEKEVHIVNLWSWAQTDNAYPRPPATGKASTQQPGWGNFNVDVVLRADPLTAVMLAVVTFISLLVAVYSIGYMHGDRGYWRFYSYIPLFVFSMTMLVSASNFVLLYVFWEAVGLCSYLLIGFWYEKPAAAAAGKKAFLVTRIGDFGFALGIFLIWSVYGTLDFHDTVVNGTVTNAGVLGQTRLAAPGLFAGGSIGTAICLLLLLGACGKSAQFPLHVWLPDAMEGPSPVSALDPRRHDGHGRGVHACPVHAAVLGVADRFARGDDYRRIHRLVRGDYRNNSDRSETHPRIFDDQPHRLHVFGHGHGHADRGRRRACFTWLRTRFSKHCCFWRPAA